MPPSAELNKLVSTLKSVDQSSFPDENERHAAIAAAREAIARLERPWDTLMHLHWVAPTLTMALQTVAQMGALNVLDADGGNPKTAAQIAQVVGADESLVDRLMRHLATNHICTQTGPSLYGPTAITREISQGNGGSAMAFTYDFAGQCALTMPEFLRKTEYKEPADVMDSNFQIALSTDKPFHGPEGWIVANPAQGKRFQDLMIGYTSQRQSWVDIYPTVELLEEGDDSAGTAIVVDVGGNAGEDLAQLLGKHPEAAGRLIVQDLEPVLAKATIPSGIEPMPHDFFTSQPVQGARAYFMHSILHDWPDHDCVRILKALRPAFGPSSRLLLNEQVISQEKAPALQTGFDMLMLMILSAKERTENDFEKVLADAGFKISKIHHGRMESVVEAVLA